MLPGLLPAPPGTPCLVVSPPRFVGSTPRCSQVHLNTTAFIQSALGFDHAGILVRQFPNTPKGSKTQKYIWLMRWWTRCSNYGFDSNSIARMKFQGHCSYSVVVLFQQASRVWTCTRRYIQPSTINFNSVWLLSALDAMTLFRLKVSMSASCSTMVMWYEMVMHQINSSETLFNSLYYLVPLYLLDGYFTWFIRAFAVSSTQKHIIKTVIYCVFPQT